MKAPSPVSIVHALATLGNVTQTEMILIAKASKEGNITLKYRRHYCAQTLPMYMSLVLLFIRYLCSDNETHIIKPFGNPEGTETRLLNIQVRLKHR